jgi:LEA14-like dessication related protein
MKGLAAKTLLAMTVAVAACSYLGRQAFEQPVVRLKTVQIAGIGLTGGSLNVDLSVYNPNHYRLDATRLTYQVLLNSDSVTLAAGTLDQQFTVGENDTAVVRIPVNFNAAGKALLNTGAVTYHVLGDIRVGSTVGSFTVPYSSTGRFTTTGAVR